MVEPNASAEIADGMMELQCISEIMIELGGRDENLLPATWMIWLGGCVRRSTAKVSKALIDLGQADAPNGLHKPA